MSLGFFRMGRQCIHGPPARPMSHTIVDSERFLKVEVHGRDALSNLSPRHTVLIRDGLPIVGNKIDRCLESFTVDLIPTP